MVFGSSFPEDPIGIFSLLRFRQTQDRKSRNQIKLIDGKAVAERINEQTREKVMRLKKHGITPGLAVVLVGDDPASMAYIRNKDRISQQLGFFSRKIELQKETSQSDLLKIVSGLNADAAIHGILVQSPPPPHINEQKIVLAIDPAKDVDGLHPMNVGKLAMGDPTALGPVHTSGLPTSPPGKRHRNSGRARGDYRTQHAGGQTARPSLDAERKRW